MTDAAPIARGQSSQTSCANCGAELRGPYCSACGQKATNLNLTLHDFLHDVTHELLHVDSKIVQSVRLLLTRPGFLTREWMAGRRARYVSPIRLYLIFSVMFFATAALAPPRIVVRVDRTDRQQMPDIGKRLAELSDQEVQEQAGHALGVWGPRVMFVVVPFCAVLVAAATRGSGRNYLQHLYFALHVHAAVFAAAAVASLVLLPLGETVGRLVAFLLMGFVAWYTVAAFRATYGGKWGRAIIRAATVAVAYMTVIVVTIVTVVAVALLLSPHS
jgi:hypothetical protein